MAGAEHHGQANSGVMPATRGALSTAGVTPPSEVFANSSYVANARLWFLGDVIAVPASWPLANVFSVGDVLIALGAAWAILATTRGARVSAPADPTDRDPGSGSPSPSPGRPG